MVFVHDFLRQHDGSKSGVHQAGQLERHPVVSGKADGHDWGALRLAMRAMVSRPWWVRNERPSQSCVGNFARGEDRQQATITQVAEGGTHAHRVRFGSTTQDIHEQQVLTKRWNQPQKLVDQCFRVGRTRNTNDIRAKPSIPPKGWLATTTQGPSLGMRAKSASDTS